MKTKWTYFKWTLTLVILPGLLIAVIISSQKAQFFAIENIEVVLTNDLKNSLHMESFLKKTNAQLESLKGHSLWDLEVTDVYDSLQKETWIESLSLTRKWPSELLVEITARETKMIYVNGQGQTFPVLADGAMLEKVDPATVPDIMVMVGKNFEKSPELRKKALAVIDEIPDEGSFSKKNIAELRFEQNTGFWVSLMQEGLQVRLGEDRVRLKAQRVSQVINYMQNQELQARVIDANFSKKVLVKLRKAP